MMTDLYLLRFALQLAKLSGVAGQIFNFPKTISFNNTCGLNPHTDWSTEGSIVLTPGDFIGFEPKVLIRVFHDVCTVDLTRCPPDQPLTSAQSCFCKSRQGDRYVISAGTRLDGDQFAGMSVQAVVPGQGPLENIFGAADIGVVPNRTDNKPSVTATYKIDDGESHDLKYTQSVLLCPKKRVVLEICVQNGRPDADLQISVEEKTTNFRGDCIDSVVTSGGDITVTFTYNDHIECRQLYRINLKEDARACTHSTPAPTKPSTFEPSAVTTPPPPTTTATTGSTTSTTTRITTTTTTAEPTTHVDRICPDTQRTVTTLPSGKTTLLDGVSFNNTWVVIQRRVSKETNFYRPYAAYVEGFGNVTSSFWIGLQQIHQLCNSKSKCKLLIHLKYDGKPKEVAKQADGCYYAMYSTFWLSGTDQQFTLNVEGYSGSAGDSLRYPVNNVNHQKFSAYDMDLDKYSGNCAEIDRGGWWYNACHHANLNGEMGVVDSWRAALWYTLSGKDSVELSEMKIRL